MPGVRPAQAERRFVTFGFTVKVGTALSADWLRPLRGNSLTLEAKPVKFATLDYFK